MRVRFISGMSLLTGAAFMVVVSQVWTGSTLKWLFFAGGVVAILIAAGDSVRAGLRQRVLDGLTALLGAWMIVEALELSSDDQQWRAFGAAVAVFALNVIALAIHEMRTERVVHELSVTTGDGSHTEPRMPIAA